MLNRQTTTFAETAFADASFPSAAFSAAALPDHGGAPFAAHANTTSVVDTLLSMSSAKQPAAFIWAGVGLYCAAVFALFTFDFSSEPMTLEAPVEMVYEEAAAEPEPAPPEPPPPVAETPPEPPPPPPPVAEAPPEPPPPPVVEEAVAPVAEPPPPPPPPKVEPVKPVAEAPPKAEAPPREKPKARPAATHTAGAVPSDYANKVYQRINRVASGSFPKIAVANKSLRVPYVIVIGQAGQLISKSVSSSGVPALDAAVAEALRRASPFPPPPNLGSSSYRLSGAIIYRN